MSKMNDKLLFDVVLRNALILVMITTLYLIYTNTFISQFRYISVCNFIILPLLATIMVYSPLYTNKSMITHIFAKSSFYTRPYFYQRLFKYKYFKGIFDVINSFGRFAKDTIKMLLFFLFVFLFVLLPIKLLNEYTKIDPIYIFDKYFIYLDLILFVFGVVTLFVLVRRKFIVKIYYGALPELFFAVAFIGFTLVTPKAIPVLVSDKDIRIAINNNNISTRQQTNDIALIMSKINSIKKSKPFIFGKDVLISEVKADHVKNNIYDVHIKVITKNNKMYALKMMNNIVGSLTVSNNELVNVMLLNDHMKTKTYTKIKRMDYKYLIILVFLIMNIIIFTKIYVGKILKDYFEYMKHTT